MNKKMIITAIFISGLILASFISTGKTYAQGMYYEGYGNPYPVSSLMFDVGFTSIPFDTGALPNGQAFSDYFNNPGYKIGIGYGYLLNRYLQIHGMVNYYNYTSQTVTVVVGGVAYPYELNNADVWTYKVGLDGYFIGDYLGPGFGAYVLGDIGGEYLSSTTLQNPEQGNYNPAYSNSSGITVDIGVGVSYNFTPQTALYGDVEYAYFSASPHFSAMPVTVGIRYNF